MQTALPTQLSIIISQMLFHISVEQGAQATRQRCYLSLLTQGQVTCPLCFERLMPLPWSQDSVVVTQCRAASPPLRPESPGWCWQLSWPPAWQSSWPWPAPDHTSGCPKLQVESAAVLPAVHAASALPASQLQAEQLSPVHHSNDRCQAKAALTLASRCCRNKQVVAHGANMFRDCKILHILW